MWYLKKIGGGDDSTFEACPADTYQPSDNGASCIACPTGAESLSTSTAQADCMCNADLGYVPSNPGSGLNYCVCAAGYYAVAGGACAQCPLGQFCPGSDTGYATTNGSGDTLDGAAQDCPANAHTLQAGEDSSADCVCDAGYTEAAPGAARRLLAVTCIQCAANTYKDSPGNTVCDTCPLYTSAPAASTTELACVCDPGYTGPDGQQCSPCAGGTYKAAAGSAACSACPADSNSPTASDEPTDCVCEPGHDGPAGGPCSDCAADTYKAAGDTECKLCDPNAASPAGSTTQTACLCNAGYTGPDGGACAACAAGTFKAALGSAACSPCHADSFSPAGSTMQYQLAPVPLSSTIHGCNENAPALQGSCDAVTIPGTLTNVLVLQGVSPGLVLRLDSVHNLSKIEVRASSLGRWVVSTGCPVEVCGDPIIFCKQLDISSSDIHEFDVSDCRATDEVYLDYVEVTTSTIMQLHYFVVYGAPPASCTCNAGYTAQSGGCSACAANSYKDAQGDVVCTVCPASAESPAAATAVAQCACPLGYTGDAHVGVDCSECPADTFKDSAGAAACTDCPDHAAAPALSDAAGDCACNAGYAGQPPGACELCAPGTYAAAGSTACASCNAEQTSPAGSDALADCECNAGYTGPNGGTCTACAAGTFKNTTGSAACAACPSNSSAPAASDALTDCTCNAGYTGSDGGTCSACPADTYKDATGAAACTSCSAHATAPAASVAATACECDLGYQGGHGTLCQQCPTGTYEDVAAHSCKLCPTHSFSPAGSAAVTACTCNVGHTGPDGGLCEACAPNTYKNTTGSAACTACTPFSTSAAGSDGANDCVCDTGYVKTGVTSCGLICQAGWQMSADGTECQPCPNSYYKAEQGEHMCTRCPAHAMHGLTGQTSVDACYCEQGYLWDAASKTCEICPAGSFNNHANESQCFQCIASGSAEITNPMIASNLFYIRCVCTPQLLNQERFYQTRLLPDEFITHSNFYEFSANPWDDWTYRRYYAGLQWRETGDVTGWASDSKFSDESTSDFFMIGIRFRLHHRTGNNNAKTILFYKRASVPAFRIEMRTGDNPGVMEFRSYSSVERSGVEYEKWISVFAQAYNNNVYVKMQVEGDTPIFFTLTGDRDAWGSNGYLQLGNYNPMQSVYSAHMDVSHLFVDYSCSNTDLLNNISFITDCSPGPCTTCGDHTTCTGLSQAPAGYQATASGANLEPCPVNHYNDGSLLHCEPCPSPSSFSSLGGLTSVAGCVCQPGYERVGGVCAACGLGSYKTATGDGPCTPCWAHATTLQTASTSPAHCKCVANYGTNKDCVLCAGHYGPQGDGATLVEPDMAWGCTNGCNCRDLANGISFDELIALNCPLCVPCGPNEFKNVVGGSGLLAWCLPCPNNSTLPIGLSHEPSSCRCDPGFTGNAGSGSGEWYEWHKQPLCTPCPIGFFKPAGGSAACTSCGFNTETAAAASTDVSACACAADYEPGSGGGPDVNGVCVASCPEGSTGAAGTCAQCEQGKFKGRKGQDQCSACTPPRTAARKGSVSKDACACPQNSMGLAPETFHAIDSVGALSTAGLDTTTFSTSTSFPADRAFRLRRLRVSGGAGTQLEVAVDGRVVFACEARDCARTSAVPLFGARGRLDVRVLAGAPQLELERHTRRAVTTTQPPAWWDQAEVERLALARSLQDGDLIFSTRTPFSTTHCQACPRRFNCKAFV
jgi:hypothetical protein